MEIVDVAVEAVLSREPIHLPQLPPVAAFPTFSALPSACLLQMFEACWLTIPSQYPSKCCKDEH